MLTSSKSLSFSSLRSLYSSHWLISALTSAEHFGHFDEPLRTRGYIIFCEGGLNGAAANTSMFERKSR